MPDSYDLAIIGAGSAGITAAQFAARAGARVALVEKHRIGGDCTWTGCVPSKALLKVARVAHEVRDASRYGLSAPAIEPVDLGRVMDHVKRAISEVYRYETPEALKGQGVDVWMGEAAFEHAHRLTITSAGGEAVITAKNVILCAGACPNVPGVRGLSSVPYITYEHVFDLDALPKHLLVIGGGPVGVEMAQAFRRLGSAVSLFQGSDRLLPRDEPEAAEVLAKVLCDEGLALHFVTRVTSVAERNGGIVVQSDAGEVSGDALLVATGRRPNVDTMRLERAGVAFTTKGVPVDERLRTDVKHIYAAGDVAGGPQFTHYAGYQAFVAARNALFPGASKGVAESAVPWTTFTDPEAARAGLTEADARNKDYGAGVGVRTMPMERVDRAVNEGDTAGFIKVVHKKDGTVVGATVVAGRAGEAIHEWILAIANNLKVSDPSGIVHVYPTYSIANQQLASAYSLFGCADTGRSRRRSPARNVRVRLRPKQSPAEPLIVGRDVSAPGLTTRTRRGRKHCVPGDAHGHVRVTDR